MSLASLAGLFEGQAKLAGGLDCQSGEFRVQMVDGKYSFGSPSDPMALQLGDLNGGFTGQFSAGPPAAISGDIQCSVGFEIDGSFSVMRAP